MDNKCGAFLGGRGHGVNIAHISSQTFSTHRSHRVWWGGCRRKDRQTNYTCRYWFL